MCVCFQFSIILLRWPEHCCLKMDYLKVLANSACVTGIVLTSLIGSIFSIYYHSQKKPINKASTFIIALAILDMFALLAVVQIPFLHIYIDLYDDGIEVPREGFSILMQFVTFSYLLILTSIAVDRVYAIYRPLQYKRDPKYIVKVFIFELVLALLLSIVGMIMDRSFFKGISAFGRTVLLASIGAAFVILLVSYFVIVLKLRSQKRRIGNKSKNTELVTKPPNSLNPSSSLPAPR